MLTRRYGMAQTGPGVYVVEGHWLRWSGTTTEGRWRIRGPHHGVVVVPDQSDSIDLEVVAGWVIDVHLPACTCTRSADTVLDVDGEQVTEYAVQFQAPDGSPSTTDWSPELERARGQFRRRSAGALPGWRYRLVSRTVSRTMVLDAVPDSRGWYR